MKPLDAIKNGFVTQLWRHSMTCKEMARLASETLERPISFSTRWRLWMHFAICVWCRRYFKHVKFLRRAAPGLCAHVGDVPYELSPIARERIKTKLRESEV